MNDEISEKSINLAVRVGQITVDEIKKNLEKLINDISEGKYAGKEIVDNIIKPEPKHGQMTLKQLSKQNDGLSTLELTDPNLLELSRVMKKHNVDFAAVKDGKGKYTLFFKGKDADAVTHALKQYTQKIVRRTKDKPSIKIDLDEAKKAANAFNKMREKVKDKSRGARGR